MAADVRGVKRCEVCNGPLTGRQSRFCSPGCSKAAARAKWLKGTYNLTPAEYTRILEYQGFACAICRREPKAGRSLAVDHAHVDGQEGPVRGLLCFFCNKRILGAKSDWILVRTAEYVTNPPAVHALGRVVTAPGRPKKPRRKRKNRP